MKTRTLLTVLTLTAISALAGCATTGELEKVQAQQRLTDAKVDQAIKDAQDAKVAADAAKARAEEAEKKAAERERLADEKAAKADAVFQKSMRK